MPMVGVIPKEDIDRKYETVNELMEKCESCDELKGRKPDDVFIYTIYKEYTTSEGEAMIAVAKYGETYAIHPPKYLKEKQWKILSYFKNDLEKNDRVIVFSEEVKEKLAGYGRKHNVQLYIM